MSGILFTIIIKLFGRDEDRAYLRVKYRVNYAFGELDEAEIASTRAEKENFLKLAMRYFQFVCFKYFAYNIICKVNFFV